MSEVAESAASTASFFVLGSSPAPTGAVASGSVFCMGVGAECSLRNLRPGTGSLALAGSAGLLGSALGFVTGSDTEDATGSDRTPMDSSYRAIQGKPLRAVW